MNNILVFINFFHAIKLRVAIFDVALPSRYYFSVLYILDPGFSISGRKSAVAEVVLAAEIWIAYSCIDYNVFIYYGVILFRLDSGFRRPQTSFRRLQHSGRN